jgi:tetratricopeptide (TPR) repeat protein
MAPFAHFSAGRFSGLLYRPSAMSKQLEPPDIHHLNAAEGWIGLGNPTEAELELFKVSSGRAQHPDVLRAWYHVHEKRSHWEEAVKVARVLCRTVPDLAFGWIHLAYALHELRRTREASEVLLPMVEKFPDEYVIRYNLACYECQMGHLEEARAWLRKAIVIAGADTIKELASSDKDLRNLWPEIQRM